MALKQLPEEFKELLKLLKEKNVKYLLIGGWAVGFYGHPRATGDLDILISIEEKNLQNLEEALIEFGIPQIDVNNLKVPGHFFRIGRPPLQIDILTEADGINFNECYKKKKEVSIDNININIISLEDLIINKKKSARYQDLADVEKLDKKRKK